MVNGVDFLITFKCPSKCKHCAYKAGPEVTGLMKDAEKWLTELVNIQPLQSVLVHGGEPFVYYSELLNFMKKAKELGVHRRYVITNGYWAETEAIANRKLEELKKAGLTHVTFSVDAFHQEFISFKSVRNAIKAASILNFEKVYVDSYILDPSNTKNPYDSITRKLVEKLSDYENVVEFSSYPLHFWGRAADVLARESNARTKTEIPKGACQPPYWIGEDMRNPKTVEIDFEGNVTLCAGISIGNARRNSLGKILRNFDWRDHPILKPIISESPSKLLEIAKKKGFRPKQGYVDECHLCYEVRKFLQPFFPQQLAPEICYLIE